MKALKKHFASLCLLLVGCLIALVLAEGLVRIFFPHARDHVISAGLFQIDNDLGWKLTPGKSAVHHSRYFDVLYTINALGYRDRPRNLSKDGDVHRILLYGDSQVFGWGVPDAQRFSNWVEDRKQSVEIWNMAVPGYGLDQEILSYEEDGRSIEADEVVFFLSGATLGGRIEHDYQYKKYKPKFVIDQNGTLKLVPIKKAANAWTNMLYKLLSPFYLPYFVERFIITLKKASGLPTHAPWENAGSGNFAMGELHKKLLERARNIAVERGQRMTALAYLPQTGNEDFRNFCQQEGIGYWEIVFRDDLRDLVIGEYDHHWNARANKLIGEQILSLLNARGE